MRNGTVLVAALLLATAGWAQDGDRRQEFQLNRMKERLGLSDEQVGKIRDLMKQHHETEEKAQKERDDKIKEVLTEEQRKQYDESGGRMGRGPGGQGGGPGGGGGGGGMMGGWLDRFLAPALDTLKRDLSLSDEQTEKVKAHLEEFNTKMRERFEEMRQQGFQGLDWQEEMQKFQDVVKDLTDKVKTHLSDEQKQKLDKVFEERFTFGNFGRPGGQGRGERREERRDERRRPPADERIRRVMEALKVDGAEDAAAVREAVKKVVEAQYALEDFDREAHGKLDELAKQAEAPEDELRTKLEELRAARREKEKAVKDAQKALYEIVTYRQELELVRQGLLR